MSKTVDERVVSMQFDNRRFERNVKTSMGTIKKLKNSLNFEETSKSLEELDKQAKNVNMKTLSKNADSVKLKFTALQVVAVRALTRIADSAMNVGKKIVASLSTDQISAGWSKFEQKTASVQTIMNSTGKSIDEVSKYLDTLMWYSDQTSYGFTDMTSALAQMTSAGGDIEKIIPLIMGVANATAFAGKGAAEFSRVMYNLNQSYSLGYLQSLDWKSLEFAGAASKQLKQTLIDVGRELGKIGDEVTVDNFMTTLATRWADKEVMEKAFGRFAIFTQAVKDAVDRGEYKTAEEAIAALSDKYEELGVKAFTAAQEAKSFSEAMNAVKDAVSSGWMQSFEIIFGNYQEAKKVWSSIYNMLYDTFASGIDTRNEILTKVFAKSGWDDIIDQGIINEEAYTNTIIKNAKKLKFPIEELIKQEGSLQNVISKGLIPVDILDKSIIDLADSYSLLSDEDLKIAGYTREQIENFRKLADGIKDGKVSLDEFYENIDKLSGRDLLLESINNIFEAASNVVNIVKEAFNEVFMPFDNDEKAQKIYNLIEALKLFTEKLKLTEEQSSKLKNVFKGLFDVVDVILYILKTVKNILYETIKSTFGLGKGILDVVSSIGKFLSSIAGLIKKSTILKNIFDTIKNILVIITDITITLTKMVLGPLSNIIDFINNLFNDFGTTIAEIGKTAKEFYNNFVNIIKESKIFGKIIESIRNILKNVINIVVEVGKTIFKLFSKVFDLKISFEAIGEAISYAAKCINKFATSIINVIKESKFLETIFGSIKISIELLVKFIIQIFSTLGTVLKATFGSIYGFIEFVTNVFTNVLTFLTKVLSGIQKIFKIFIDSNVTVLEFIIGIFKNIWNFLESVLNKIINWFSNLVESFKNGSIKITDVLKNVLIAGIISVLTFLIVKLATFPIKALNSFFGGVGEACTSFAKKMKSNINPLMTISKSILMLVASIIALSLIDKTKLQEAIANIVIIFGILTLMTKLIASTSIFSGIDNFKKGYGIYKALSSIESIAFALLLIIAPLAILGSMNKDKLMQGLYAMIIILESFVLVLLSLSKIKINNINDIKKKVSILYNLAFGLTALTLPLAIVTAILTKTDWSKVSDKALYTLAGVITALAVVMVALSFIGSKGNKTKVGLKNINNTLASFSFDTNSLNKVAVMIAVSTLLISLAGSIALLVDAYQKIGTKGLLIVSAVLIGLLGIIVAFVASIRKLVTDIKSSWTAIGYISIMSGLILSLTGSMLLLSLIDWKKVLSASVGILAIGLVLSGLMATLMIVKKLGSKGMQSKTLIEFAGSVAILSSSLMLLIAPLLALSILNWPQILSGVAGMAVVLVSLSAAASLISKTKADESLKSLANALLKISLAIIAVTSSILIVVLAMKLLGNMISETTIEKIAEMAAAIGVAIVNLLVSILATLADSMPQLVAILVKIFYYLNEAIVKTIPIIAKGILDIIIKVLDQLIVYIPLVIAKILDLVIKITNTLALYIPKLLISTVLDFIATVLENVLKSVIKYIVEFLTRIVNEVKNIDPNFLVNLLDSLKCINSIMLQLIESSLLIPLAMPAAVALLTFIGELTLILGAISKLNEWFNLESIANNVSSVLEAIGKAIGNFIGGILGGATASFSLIALPTLGNTLSSFMTNLKEFIIGLESIRPDSIKNGMDLIKLITIITATSFINSIFDFVSSFTGNDSMTKFANNISKFGEGLKEFDKSTKNIDANKIKQASEAGILLAKMTEKITKEGGLAQVFCGTADFAKFSENIATYGEALKSFEESTRGASLDQVEPAARAGKLFAEMINNIPVTNGWQQIVDGFPNFEEFSKNIGSFGTSLKIFANETKGISFDNAVPAAEAGTAFAEMIKALPDTGGVKQEWFGEKDFAQFNKNIVGFGEALIAFYNKISILGAYDLSRIEKASNSLTIIVLLITTIYGFFLKNYDFFLGLKDINNILPSIFASIGKGIYELCEALKNVDISEFDTVAALSDSFTNILISYASIGRISSDFINGISIITTYITKLSEAMLNYYNIVKNINADTLETKTKEFFEAFDKTVIEFANPLRNNDLYTNFKDYGEYIGNAIMDGIRESLSKGMDLLDDGIGDNVIVIKPVLDLTNFKSGVSDMDNIISLRTPNRTINNANSINSIIEQNQNNGNGDLLSAIKGLSNKLDNLSGDTYNINGITYDDGSAVQDAIKTLVRAAKIKGRV